MLLSVDVTKDQWKKKESLEQLCFYNNFACFNLKLFVCMNRSSLATLQPSSWALKSRIWCGSSDTTSPHRKRCAAGVFPVTTKCTLLCVTSNYSSPATAAATSVYMFNDSSSSDCRPWQSSSSVWTGICPRRPSRLWSCWESGSPWMWRTLWSCCHPISPTPQWDAMRWLGYSRLMMR